MGPGVFLYLGLLVKDPLVFANDAGVFVLAARDDNVHPALAFTIDGAAVVAVDGLELGFGVVVHTRIVAAFTPLSTP